MLPSGHFAAGYLVTRLAVNSLLPYYTFADQTKFWVFGILAAVIVDLDEFYAFKKMGMPIAGTKEVNHRNFITHAPLLHLLLGGIVLAIGFFAGAKELEFFAILYILGMMTHFILDSFGYGIMWLWPLNNQVYSFRDTGRALEVHASSVVNYWKGFLGLYFRDMVFYLEALIILVALYVKFL